jgi:uncharacterized Zn ribbon protein
MLTNTGYVNRGTGDAATANFLLVNTDRATYKGGATAGDRPVYNAASQFTAIQALITGRASTPATLPAAPTRSIVSAPTVSATTPVATALDANGTQIHVGDTVRMTNTRSTKPGFRLNSGTNYIVNLITASGKIGLAGVPDNQFLPKRATVVRTTTPAGVTPVAPARTTTRVAPAPRVVQQPAVDAAGNTLRVGDTVMVLQPIGKKRLFNLRPNGVATITSITPKGALGFAFDRDNQFLAKRFQKVSKETVSVVVTPASRYRPGTNPSLTTNLRSGDKVIAAPRRDNRFPLTPDTAYTFRGLTVDGGSLILDGQTGDQYAPSRFTIIRPVGTVRNR